MIPAPPCRNPNAQPVALVGAMSTTTTAIRPESDAQIAMTAGSPRSTQRSPQAAASALVPEVDPLLATGVLRVQILGMIAGGGWWRVTVIRDALGSGDTQTNRQVKTLRDANYLALRKEALPSACPVLEVEITPLGSERLATFALSMYNFASRSYTPDKRTRRLRTRTMTTSPTAGQMEAFLDITGRQIRTLRSKAGHSPAELARGLSRALTVGTLRGYENGTQPIRVDTFVELCLTLNARPGDVLGKICDHAFADPDPVHCDLRLVTAAQGLLAPLGAWASQFLQDNPGQVILRPDVVLLSRMASDCDIDIGTVVDELRKLSPHQTAEAAGEVDTPDPTSNQ